MKLTPIQVRVAFYALAAGLVLALFFLWLNDRDKKLALRDSAEQGVRTDRAASGIAQDAGVAQSEVSQNEQSANNARSAYYRGYEDAKRNDPDVVPWGSRPVPQRLRDLARERRLARERSGCVGDGCGSADGAEGRGTAEP